MSSLSDILAVGASAVATAYSICRGYRQQLHHVTPSFKFGGDGEYLFSNLLLERKSIIAWPLRQAIKLQCGGQNSNSLITAATQAVAQDGNTHLLSISILAPASPVL